ncbi:ceramide kinase isoform X1 [Silene latifolia]|uniref:ceramide kinase isoform X1 n=1 Tax=Silene latifolia TaxID=37657 RepID=UPI003D77D236
MERDGDNLIEENCLTNGHFEGEPFLFSSKVFLDNVGEVILCFSSTGLSWKSADSLCDQEKSPCLGRVFRSESAAEIYFSDVYATKLTGWGVIQQPAGCCFLHQDLEMHRFVVHGMQKSKANPSLWQLVEYTFGHKNQPVCQMLVDQITAHLNKEMGRPKSLLVFVNPKSGKGNGQKIWEGVAPIFSRAKVKAQVTVTERAGHAFDQVASMTSRELNTYDGIVAVGGDGLFNEILNGLTTSRFKGKCPPVPPDFLTSTEKDPSDLVFDPNEAPAGTEETSCSSGDDVGFSIPHKWFRLGLIPGGSTDAIVICTTGVRDPTTSALHIVLGKRIGLDIAQVVRWKATNTSKVEPLVRYTASFVGYGFYGDVITESEKYRWMGPKRYDVAGTQVFLRHKSYEAEVSYLDLKYEETTQHLEEGNLKVGTRSLKNHNKKREREICRTNCEICCMPSPSTSEPKWLSAKGRYLSVGAAVISCRNERAPDGLVADAHLSDGLLHLILIKTCPHPSYLWHLTHLARKGGSPLDFKFVEHHKTPAFVFTSVGKEGVWNLDGEILHAHKLSAQVFRGLVNLFAAGPEN